MGGALHAGKKKANKGAKLEEAPDASKMQNRKLRKKKNKQDGIQDSGSTNPDKAADPRQGEPESL